MFVAKPYNRPWEMSISPLSDDLDVIGTRERFFDIWQHSPETWDHAARLSLCDGPLGRSGNAELGVELRA